METRGREDHRREGEARRETVHLSIREGYRQRVGIHRTKYGGRCAILHGATLQPGHRASSTSPASPSPSPSIALASVPRLIGMNIHYSMIFLEHPPPLPRARRHPRSRRIVNSRPTIDGRLTFGARENGQPVAMCSSWRQDGRRKRRGATSERIDDSRCAWIARFNLRMFRQRRNNGEISVNLYAASKAEKDNPVHGMIILRNNSSIRVVSISFSGY